MEKEKIDRINELGRLSRLRELTEAERAEQRLLREEYLRWFRRSIRGIVEPENKTDGRGNEDGK